MTMDLVTEPNLALQNVAILAVPFGAYFLGILIRKIALPGPNSPPLWQQCLLGVPVGLVIVSPTLALLRSAFESDLSAYLFAVGIIIEHGMLVQETTTRQLQELRRNRGPILGIRVATPGSR